MQLQVVELPARCERHATAPTKAKALFGYVSTDAEGHLTRILVEARVDLAHHRRGKELDAERQVVLEHRARRRLDRGVEALHRLLVRLALAILVAVRGKAVEMFHERRRLGPRKLQEAAVLTLVELALVVAVVAALRTCRATARLFQIPHFAQVTTDTADRPLLDQRVLFVADRQLLDREPTTVGVEMVGRRQLRKRCGRRADHLHGLFRRLALVVRVVDRAVERHTTLGERVVRQETVIGQQLERLLTAVDGAARAQNLDLTFDLGSRFLRVLVAGVSFESSFRR